MFCIPAHAGPRMRSPLRRACDWHAPVNCRNRHSLQKGARTPTQNHTAANAAALPSTTALAIRLPNHSAHLETT